MSFSLVGFHHGDEICPRSFLLGIKKGVPCGHPKLYASLNLRKHLQQQAKLISNQLQLISAKNRS